MHHLAVERLVGQRVPEEGGAKGAKVDAEREEHHDEPPAVAKRVAQHRREAKAIQNVTTAEFMREWHDLEATRTQDGFNPLVDDFTNTRFVVTG